FVPIFITGISLAVSVIPEGLVAVTTVTMAVGVRRMARRNALVRTLPAVETLGGVTVICSDKTGTLTEGKMGVSELVDANGMVFEFSKSTSRDPNEGEVSYRGHISGVEAGDSLAMHNTEKQNTAAADMSFVVCSLCNNSEVFFDSAEQQWSSLGDATEVALTIASQKAGLRKTDITSVVEANVAVSTPAMPPLKMLAENAFDSERKRMSVVFEASALLVAESASGQTSATSGKRCLVTLVKGAPEEILSVCTHQLSDTGGFLRLGTTAEGRPAMQTPEAIVSGIVSNLDTRGTVALTSELINSSGSICEQMAGRGLRVLGLAAKITYLDADAPVTEEALGLEWAESELVFAGLVGLIDPPRSGIIDSVRRCHDAGVKVIMITGDHIGTATAIA
ncbi:hypothetical protein LPJ71_010712, partial [Coemansia sp. S17]